MRRASGGALLGAALLAAPTVTKVEPPFWWASHAQNPVRLLLRGEGLRDATVASEKPQVVTSNAAVNPAGTALFVDAAIDPKAPPGEYPLTVRVGGGAAATVSFRVEAPLDPAANFQGITGDDVIYLIMTDRFADGDPANNTPPGAPPDALNRREPRTYHGGDFRGIIDHLPYLKDLGVTALWLTPWYDNWNGVNHCDQPWCPTTYYHGYHAIDFYAVEDRFGDRATLRELVSKAHASGIKIVQDQVANHVGIQHPWAADPPLPDWFHGTVARHVKNPFRTERLLSPHAAPAGRREVLDGWFADDMPDLNQEQPEVARYLIQNSLWWAGVAGLDGIRQDTAQFLPRPFLRDFCDALHRQHPRLWIVGEVLDTNPLHTAFFLGGRPGWDGVDTRLDSVFDFSLWAASAAVFTGKQPATSLRDVLKADAAYPDASRLATVAGNHDLKRILSFPGATLDGALLHAAFLLTARGIPQLYYGDEVALEGGDDPDNRRDFPPAAFTDAGRGAAARRMFAWTRDLIHLRRAHSALRRGAMIDLHADDASYAFVRRDAAETLVVVLNRGEAPKTLAIPLTTLEVGPGRRLESIFGPGRAAVADDGGLTVYAPAGSAVIYVVGGR